MKRRSIVVAVMMMFGCHKGGELEHGSKSAVGDPSTPAVDAPDPPVVDAATPSAVDPLDPDPVSMPEPSQSGCGSGDGARWHALPGQQEPCPEGRCAVGLACVSYLGIAGGQGPTFTSCEIRCGHGELCPASQTCVTVADGPGQVCRPVY